MQEVRFNYVHHATVVQIFGRVREKLNGLLTDATGYMIAEIIWKSRNKVRKAFAIYIALFYKISI